MSLYQVASLVADSDMPCDIFFRGADYVKSGIPPWISSNAPNIYCNNHLQQEREGAAHQHKLRTKDMTLLMRGEEVPGINVKEIPSQCN